MPVLLLNPQETVILGRGVHGVGNDQRVSRNHAEVSRNDDQFAVKALGMNPMFVQSGTEFLRLAAASTFVWPVTSQCRMFYLIRDADHNLLYEFKLEVV